MPQYTSADMTKYRMIADAPADNLIRRVLEEGAVIQLNELLRSLSRNNSFETDALPAPIREFVAKASQMPEWYNAQKAACGEQLFTKYGMEICVILLCKSLPECYLCWRGAAVLYETGRLAEQRLRFPERFQFFRRDSDDTACRVANGEHAPCKSVTNDIALHDTILHDMQNTRELGGFQIFNAVGLKRFRAQTKFLYGLE